MKHRVDACWLGLCSSVFRSYWERRSGQLVGLPVEWTLDWADVIAWIQHFIYYLSAWYSAISVSLCVCLCLALFIVIAAFMSVFVCVCMSVCLFVSVLLVWTEFTVGTKDVKLPVSHWNCSNDYVWNLVMFWRQLTVTFRVMSPERAVGCYQLGQGNSHCLKDIMSINNWTRHANFSPCFFSVAMSFLFLAYHVVS